MSIDATPAESSPAPETPVAVTATDHAVVSGDQAAYRAARQAERSGKPLDVAAESSPATPVDQAASTEVTDPPASEPGKPPTKNAETRIKELLAKERAATARAEAAERRAADLEAARTQPKDEPKAAPSPAPAPAAFPPYDTYLTTHPDASYEDYLDARADFRADQRFEARQAEETQATERQRRTQSQTDRDTQFRTRIQKASEADPEFFNSLSDEVKALKPFEAIRDDKGRWTAQPSGMHAIAEEVLSSEVAPQLMRHFSDHPEDLQRIAALLPAQLLKEMGKLEARMSETTTPVVQPPKTVTDAPPPPTTLGTKPGAPANAVEAAVVSGDVAAYREARQRERMAALR